MIALGLGLVGVGAAVLWPREAPPVRDRGGSTAAVTQRLPTFEPIDVASAGGGGLALTGTVHDAAGQVVPGAEVSLAASAQASLASVRCGECGELLLSCAAAATRFQVGALLTEGRGALNAGAHVRTDAQGRFRFENLRGVSFTVWAWAEGHGAAIHERAAPGDPVALYLPPPRALAGVVTDEGGAAIAGATVHVLSRRIPVPVVVTTGSDGSFDARGLGEGPFYVHIQAKGFLPFVKASVEAGPQPVRAKLMRPRVLEVEVRQGDARVEAQVTISGDHLERTATAAGGLATVGELFPEEVWVTASRGELTAPVQRVLLTELRTRVRLDLDAGGRLAITVVDESGHPVPDPEIWLLRAQQSEPFLKKKAKTGELVQVGPLAVGEYVLIGEAEGFRPTQLPVRVTEEETPVELVLQRGTTIRGRVLDEYGRPAPRISVLVQPTGEIAHAKEDGTFVASVPSPGLYELQAHHSDWGGGHQRVTAPADGVELHLEPRAGLRVTVTVGGRRVEGADAVLWVERDASWRNDRPSGADGVVLMRGMPPNTYSLVATHRDHLPSVPQKVTLREGELVDVQVELSPGVGISGRVVDEAGAPISGVSVGLIPRGVEPVLTDSDGRFDIRPVREGRSYRVQAAHPAYDQRERPIVRAGSEPVTVTLQRRAVYRGRVISSEGEPVRSFRIDEHEVSSSDGRFELALRTEEGRVFAVVEAPGFQPEMVDAAADQTELGDVRLQREPQLAGFVRDEGGGPIEGAVIACDVCDGQVASGTDGRFTLSVPRHLTSVVITATKGALSGTLRTTPSPSAPIEVRVRTGVRVSGRVYLPGGGVAAGTQVEAVHTDRSEPFTFVTMADGSYEVTLPEGSYRFILPGSQRPFAGDPVVFITVRGQTMLLDLGAAPGTSSVSVRVAPKPGHALWLVRGTVTQVADPPMELFRSEYAQMVYQPRSEQVLLTGVAPGRYTLVWSRFHAQTEGGPVLRHIDVPAAAEVSLAQ